MSDKKLTDEEIIKALECCISTTTEEACAGCPFNKQKLCDKDQWALERYALDLINRQKAEIEKMKTAGQNISLVHPYKTRSCVAWQTIKNNNMGGKIMSDKKFTDEEIKSSLEVIATTQNCNECKIRNCKWGTCNCSQITANAALDLINRQKEEIERLKNRDMQVEVSDKLEREIKAEAVKEFAEKLEEKLGCCHIISDGEHCGFDCGDTHGCIDDLLKEMVGVRE